MLARRCPGRVSEQTRSSSAERVSKAAAKKRQRDAQRAERAMEHGAPRAQHALDSDLLLIIDPQVDQPAEVGHELFALMFWIGHVDRLGQHPVEIRR